MLYFVWKHIQLRAGNESTFIDVATKFKEIFQKHSVGRASYCSIFYCKKAFDFMNQVDFVCGFQ
jgi:hypothetical protein